MELLLVIGITGMVLVPVMAWSITALGRQANEDVDADTAAFAQLNHFFTPDVARSISGAAPVPVGGFCGTGSDPALLRLEFNRASPEMVTYHRREKIDSVTGVQAVDSGTGQDLFELVRRTCVPDDPATATVHENETVVDETIVADQLVGNVIVKCKPRKKFANPVTIDGSSSPEIDECGEVAMTLQGVYGSPVTLRATRQVDPEPDPTPGSRPIPVIACSPACPAVGYRSLTINFDGTLSSDRDPGGVTGWAWDFGDGTPLVPNGRVTHTFDQVGTFQVSLAVSNASGGTKSITTTVTVKNARPEAVATPNPVTAFRQQAVQFMGSRSVDPDGDVAGTSLSFLWDFGDGVTATDPDPFHTYTGTFLGALNPPASLTVSDEDPDEPLSSSVNIPVNVVNNPPKVELSSAAPFIPVDCDETNPAAGKCIRVNDFPITVQLRAITPDSGALGATDLDGNVPPGNYKWDIRRKGSALPYADPRTLGNGRTLGFTFNQNGVYTVSLEVTDNDAGRTIRTIEVVVNNRPIASANPARCVINVGQPATCEFDASGSSDPDGELVGYKWDWGDGTIDEFTTANGNLDQGVVRSHTWDPRPALGTSFPVKLTVTDNDGTSTSLSIPVKVNRAPVPVIGILESPVYRKKEATFLATGSSDPDGDPETGFLANSYTWDFGDGNTGTGHTPGQTYQDVGTYLVKLTATDQDGGVATVQLYVNVVNQPPVAVINLGTPYVNGAAPYILSSSALPTSYDPDGTIVSYEWDFGDGTTATGPSFTHEYPARGKYDLKLKVTDNNGATATDVRTIKVNQAPIARFTTDPAPPTKLDPPLKVTFDASTSTDPDGGAETNMRYMWDFGDGTVTGWLTNPVIDHTFTTRDQFTVTLTVDDNQGGQDTKTVVALVGINKLPIVKLKPTPTGGIVAGQNVKPATWSFDPAGTFDPDGSIAQYTWNFGDGTPTVTQASGPLGTLSHTFNDFGTFVVRLTVVDNLGSSAYAEVTVKVNQKPVAVIKPSTPSPLLGGNGVPVNFDGLSSYDPDGTISAYLWNFGDGGTSTDSKPSHTWTTNGTYTVTLKVQDNNVPGYQSDVVSRQIVISNSPPTANIVTTPGPNGANVVQSPNKPFLVQFNGTGSFDPDGNIVSYDWDFDDGTAHGTTPTVSHSFTEYGTYMVKLTVTDNSGLTDTKTVKIRVNHAPLPVISVVSGYPCGAKPPCTVVFDASNSSDPDGTLVGRIQWSIDGTNVKSVPWTDGDTLLSYTFTHTGSKNLVLTVADNDGQSASALFPVYINRPPVAGFTTTPNPPVLNAEPYTIQFNGGSPYSVDPDGTIISYLWDFGDGTSSTDAAPSKTYAAPGSYNVTLEVTDNQGVKTKSAPVAVRANQAPTAKIGPDVLDPKLGLDFHFDGSGSTDPDGTISTYAWDFGDGQTSTEQSPVHIYAANGDYTVTLVVTDNDGRTDSDTRTLTVAPNVDPTASFVTDPANGRGDGAPATIGFDASGSDDPDGQIVTYAWDFGDGTTGTGKTTTHVYATYGTFTATLTVTDNNGATDVMVRQILINQVPIASIQTFPSPAVFNVGDAPYTTDFFAELSQDPDGTIVSYDWDFNDGTTGTGTPVSHTFADFGTYEVTLTVTDNDGATATATVEVKVNRPPHVSATYSPSDVRREMEVSFDASSTYDEDGTIVLYQWAFGDGYIGSGRNTTHTYDASLAIGDYEVVLTVVDNDGGQSSYTFTVHVGNADPIPKILATPSDPTHGVVIGLNQPVQFYGDASVDPDGTIVSYEWDFGDQTSDSGVEPAPKSYDKYGTWPVTLTVTDNDGSVASTMIFVTINQSPVAVMGPTDGITRGIEFQFTSTGSNDPDGTIDNYYWDFGDGTNATGPSPKHTYSASGGLGPFTVMLIVTDNLGFQTIAQRNITLINQTPTAKASAQRVFNGVVGGAPSGPPPLEIEFTDNGSFDPDGTIAKYSWNFGDGSPATTPSANPTVRHTYSGSARTVTAVLTVTDNNGATATVNVPITVTTNQAPVASFYYTQQSIYGGPVTVNASDSHDPDGWIVSYDWDFDTRLSNPSDLASGVEVTRTLPVGYWTIRLTVTDNSNRSTTTEQSVWVRGSTPAPVLEQVGSGKNFTWTQVPGAVEYKLFSEHTGGCGSNDNKTITAQTNTGSLNFSEPWDCDWFDNQVFRVYVQSRNYGSNEWSDRSNYIEFRG